MQNRLVRKSPLTRDLDRLIVTDSAPEAAAAIAVAMRRFGLTYGPRLKRRWIFAGASGAPMTDGVDAVIYRKLWITARKITRYNCRVPVFVIKIFPL
jgi:hypothetical protein